MKISHHLQLLAGTALLTLGLAGCEPSPALVLRTSVASSTTAPSPASADNAVSDQMKSAGVQGVPLNAVTTANTQYSTGLFVLNGQVAQDRSTPASVQGGKITDNTAAGLRITSDAPDFNGILVRGGKIPYQIRNVTVNLSGNGSDDFVGLGAGTMADGGATVELHNAHITTTGLIRSAVITANHSVMKIYDSTLIVNGGALPEHFKPKIGPGMFTPPDGLHIGGTARAALTVDNSKSYYYRTNVISGGWAGLSTDNANGYVYVEADDSNVVVKGPGYGVYSDTNCHVVINRTRITTQTYNAVMAGIADLSFNQVTGKSSGNVIMIHDVLGKTNEIAKLVIKGGNFHSDKAAIWVRSANADLNIDGARIQAANGVLLQSNISDDMFATKVNGQPTPGINARLANMMLKGDIEHDDSDRKMTIRLIHTRLTGRIENAAVSLTDGSQWTATGDSRVTLLGTTNSKSINAPQGVTITATAGEGSTLSGIYHLAGGGMLQVN